MSRLLDAILSAFFGLLSLYSQWKHASAPRRYDDARTVEHKALTRGLGMSIVAAGMTGLLAIVAYSTRSRTPFRSDGGQHSTVMADTVPR